MYKCNLSQLMTVSYRNEICGFVSTISRDKDCYAIIRIYVEYEKFIFTSGVLNLFHYYVSNLGFQNPFHVHKLAIN